MKTRGYLGLFLLTFIVYMAALHAGFIWNDGDYVTRPELRTGWGLARIWFNLGATQQYYPILHSAFWLEYRLWGDAAWGYHLTNIFCHALNACLLVAILRRLWGPRLAAAAWLAGALFAVHPVCVESVAWISEQKNTLSTSFALLAVLAYLDFDASRRPGAYAAATVLFLLALLSKTVTATVPAALLVVLWWRRGRLQFRYDLLPLLPWLGLGAAAGLFSAWVERRYLGASGPTFALTWAQRAVICGRAIGFYLGKLLWPADLVFIYPRWTPGASLPRFLPLLAVAAALAFLWSVRGRRRGPLAGALLFVGMLFPVLGFLNVYAFVFSFVADHFQYLACIPVLALAAAGWGAWLARSPRSAFAPWSAAFLVLGSLGAQSARLVQPYHDLFAFYSNILRRNPECWMAHDNLGVLLDQAGRPQEAMAHYRQALRLKPDDADAHADLGVALDETGWPEKAIAEENAALRFRPRYTEAHINLGKALRHAGRASEAASQYEMALLLDPASVRAKVDLGVALAALGRTSDAIVCYEEALRQRPDLPEIHLDYGTALLAAGRRAQAIRQFEAVLRLDPASPEGHLDLGVAWMEEGELQQAAAEYANALRLRPGYAEAHYNLGLALARNGRLSEALDEFQQAVRLRPGYAEAHRKLGIVLQAMGRLPEAAEEFQTAATLNSGR